MVIKVVNVGMLSSQLLLSMKQRHDDSVHFHHHCKPTDQNSNAEVENPISSRYEAQRTPL
jgi:hypothetical protein